MHISSVDSDGRSDCSADAGGRGYSGGESIGGSGLGCCGAPASVAGLGGVGGVGGVGGAGGAGFTIDTAGAAGAAALPISRMLGHIMGIPGLTQLKPDTAPNPVLTRANNMASLVTAMLLKFKPEHREEMLTSIGGLNWTSQVLQLAKGYPGVLGVSDAVRFSMALHFLVGIMDADAKKPTLYASGYWAFKKVLEDAQARARGGLGGGLSGGVGGGLGGGGLGGLGGLGGASVLRGLGITDAQNADAQAIAEGKFARELARLNAAWSSAAEAENDDELARISTQIASLQANKAAWIADAKAAYLGVTAAAIAAYQAEQQAKQQSTAVAQQQMQQQVQQSLVRAESVSTTMTPTTAPPPPMPVNYGGTATVPPESRVIGVVDSLAPDGRGNFIARGWACVRGRVADAEVKFYAGGPANTGSTLLGSTIANMPREAAVGAACGLTNPNHGFQFVITPAMLQANNGRSLHVHGTSTPFGGANEALDRTGAFTLQATVIGVPAPAGAPIPIAVQQNTEAALRERAIAQFNANVLVWRAAFKASHFMRAPTAAEEEAEVQRIMGELRAQVQFPAPPDIAALDYSRFQTAACIRSLYVLSPQDKETGIRIQFQRVFGRAPNKAEVQYFGELKWCSYKEGTEALGPSMEGTMRAIAQGIRDGKIRTTTPGAGEGGIVGANAFETRTSTSDMENAIKRAADDALNFVGKAADFVIDVLCKGFKQLLGEAVGGAVCDVLKVVISVAASTIVAASKIITDALSAIVGFIRELIAGRTEQAFMVLLKGVGMMLFNLSAPVMVPVLMKGRSLADGFRELDELAKKVVNRNPLFPLMLIMAIVGVVTSPTPPAIGALVLAMAPMLGVFMAPALKKLEPLKDAILEDIERGVEKMMKLCVIVIQGLMDITALMSTLKAQLVAYFTKKFKDADAGWKFAGDLIKNLGKGIEIIITAVRTFQFGTITEVAVKILSVVPELLLAILPDAVAELPALSQWVAAAKNAGDSVDKQQANLAMGAREILRNMGAPDRILFIQEQVAAMSFTEAAGVAARIVGEQFKKQASYPQFVATFKSELLKV